MTTDTTSTKDETRVRALIEDCADATRTKDAARSVSYYAPDVVTFELAPPLQYRGAGVLDPAGVASWYETWAGPLGYDVTGLTITVRGDVAFCHSLDRLRGTKTDGVHVDLWFRSTVGLKKVGGTWKIAHVHSSTPFYMDGSERAALDLRP